MPKQTKQSGVQTSFYDTTIKCTAELLKVLLGEPDDDENMGNDKVNMEWVRETDDGELFTVYDWKVYRPIKPGESVEWHIGGKDKKVTDKAANEIMALAKPYIKHKTLK